MVLPLLLALVLLALLALPWAAGLGAILLQGALHRRLLARERHLSTPARHWLRSAADAEGLAVHIEVHEALTEGWFPHARTVGLSPGAADSDHPVHRAMAAHELGHAATTTTLGGLSGLLPTARLLGSGLPFATAAAFVVAALHDSLLAAVGGAVLLGLTALTHGGILLDEALASRRAWAWLARDPELTPADRRACQRAFLTAAAAYATPAAGWLLLLAASPALVALALAGPGLPPADPLDATGTWLLLLLAPVLLLQAGLLASEAVRPEPVHSAFHLELRQERIHAWSFTGGLCALVVALGVAGWHHGAAWEAVLALAVFTGLGPASILLRAILLIPVLLAVRLVGLEGRLDGLFVGPGSTSDAPPRAVAGLWERPPLSLRAARLLQLGWVPLVAWVVAAAA